ncbi:hypothetical protein SUNI508_08620 [Seiridium unicorne]|uniref:Uncharacterized protein n=1 Tax=Seiridium unicorne TaxID=138068 RepID=A0ABR2UTW6_9PEZI
MAYRLPKENDDTVTATPPQDFRTGDGDDDDVVFDVEAVVCIRTCVHGYVESIVPVNLE